MNDPKVKTCELCHRREITSIVKTSVSAYKTCGICAGVYAEDEPKSHESIGMQLDRLFPHRRDTAGARAAGAILKAMNAVMNETEQS